jgi:hypothetical protein
MYQAQMTKGTIDLAFGICHVYYFFRDGGLNNKDEV